MGWHWKKQVHEDAGPTKVLQSEYHNVVVVGLPNGTVSVTIGNQLDMLQTSDHTTGDVMAALVSRHNLGTVTDASKFDRYVRSVCTDRYYPNKTGEAEVAHRFLNALLHLFCHCHVLACELKFTKVLWKSAANGARAYLRSLRAPGQMSYFRAAARVVLWRKLQVKRGPVHLQEGAEEYKVFILDILLPAGTKANRVLRRKLLLLLPGDWRSPVLDFFSNDSKEEVFKLLDKEIIQEFFGVTPAK